MTKDKLSDHEIDEIVDDLVKDEKTAAALKDKLHVPFSEPKAHYTPQAPVNKAADDSDDDDDLWDNMPV